MWTSVIISAIVLVLILLTIYCYFKYKFNFWDEQYVQFIPPRIPFGNLQGRKRKYHSSILFQHFYNELKHRGVFGGLYFFTKPACIITDLNYLKKVLIKEFEYFHDRGAYYNDRDDPLSGHLFNLEGDRWKKLREKLTPTFTSSKMKYMFSTILAVTDRLEKYVEKTILEDPEPEIKNILARFTTDIIGTCAFGIECNSLEESDAKFLKMGMKVFEPPRNSFFKQLLMLTYPNMARRLRIKGTRDDVSAFFMKTVKEVVEYREKNKIKRNDFMDLLLQLKNNESVGEESNHLEGMSIEEIAAQVFVFFLAGFETSSTTMTFCLHELSLNQEIQERARQNVIEVLTRHDGEITYDALSEMTYLEQCVNEALRKYPPASTISRIVTKPYYSAENNVMLEKGTPVFVSIYGIHHDPEIYPDPEVYDPDRFLPQKVSARHPMAFLPFGQGPRMCIGERFGYLETKMGLARLLSKFRFLPSDKTKTPLEFSKKNIILSPEGGLFLKIEKI